MHNWGLAWDINLPLLFALFIYFHSFISQFSARRYIALPAADTLIPANKGAKLMGYVKKCGNLKLI